MFKSFLHQERGWVTITALFIVLFMLMIGGLAVDTNRAYQTKNKLQNATDAAALAAAQFLPDVDEARAKAEAYLAIHFPPENYGTLILEDDIVFGTWDAVAGQMDQEDAPTSVVIHARLSNSELYESVTRHYILSLFGVKAWDIDAISVAGSIAAPLENCVQEDLLGNLTDFLFVITDGNSDANWQSSSPGYVGDVAVNGLVARERSSGSFDYIGTIHTNRDQLDRYQRIINNNPSTASVQYNQHGLLDMLEADLEHAIATITDLPVTPGFESRSSSSLNGLDVQDGQGRVYVINVTSGLSSSSPINIYGDEDDLFILRWDTNPSVPGYFGEVRFSGGGGINPLGALTPANFVHVAGSLNSSGGGSNLSGVLPYIAEIPNSFSGGGFFVGYWLTTGDPSKKFESSSFSNARFVGGWYTSATKFSMTSGTAGVHVLPTRRPSLGQCEQNSIQVANRSRLLR